MEAVDFLPLGSVVVLKGAIRKTIIIARGLAVKLETGSYVFDYAGCPYPEGLMGDQLGYFNHNDIVKVVFHGLSDDDNALMVDNIHAWLEMVDLPRGNPREINEAMDTTPPPAGA